jgi:5-methylcytosine-specific restriction endonuclease McrA
VKSLDQFYRHKKTKDGAFPECKKCNIERARKWQRNNPEEKKRLHREYWHRHRTKLIRNLKKSYDRREYDGLREKVIKRDGEKCRQCGMTRKEHLDRWGADINVDHLNRNREENTMENLQTICLICHGSKHAKDNGGRGQFQLGNKSWKRGSKKSGEINRSS